MKPYFHLFRGVPGTGKSTAAKKLQEIFVKNGASCWHFEADMYFMRDGVYKFNAGELRFAHEWCQKMTTNKLSLDEAVIVSNTFTSWKEIKPYVEIARRLRIPLIITSCETEYGNVHGVPEDKLQQMRDRYQSQDLIAHEIVFNYNDAIVEIDRERHILVKWGEKDAVNKL